jgi:ubiquinone/menaquinone biosynthesis C-methylase UbiE
MKLQNFFRRIIASQFRQPKGLLGHWAARFMEKNNQAYYRKVVDLLEIKDQDKILEIGCGAGLAIKILMEKKSRCRIWGLDFSGLMIRKAVKNNRLAVKNKQVEFMLGDFCKTEFPGRIFTKIFGINVIYFWDDLNLAFAKLNKILSPAGRLIIYMSGPERLNKVPFATDGIFNKYSLQIVLEKIRQNGFAKVSYIEDTKLNLPIYFICAEK